MSVLVIAEQEFAASMKAVGASMRDNPDWGCSQTAFTEFMLRLFAAPFGGSTWYGEPQQRCMELTTICKDYAAAVIGRPRIYIETNCDASMTQLVANMESG